MKRLELEGPPNRVQVLLICLFFFVFVFLQYKEWVDGVYAKAKSRQTAKVEHVHRE